MSAASWVQFFALIALVLVTGVPLGRYMARVYGDGERAPGDRFFTPIENVFYRVCRIDPQREQRWTVYAYSLIGFSLMSFLMLYLILRLQGAMPVNPTDVGAVIPHLSFNTAVSFVTNTNWQSYGGEDTMSHFTQMIGLTVQNFVSAAVGMATVAALIRGLARRRAGTIGNFWVDLTRGVTRILLPLSILVAVVLIGLGVVQNLSGFTAATTIEAGTEQLIPGGPVASQVAIRQLGTNGGGFYNTNAAHPFENPTGLTNFIELWAEVVIPFAFAFTFGRMVKDRRQGRAVFAVMFVLWAGASLAAMGLEGNGNPRLDALGADQSVSAEQSGGNMEGKEIRFGTAASGLYAASTTGTSTGSVNSMHDSFTPLGGGVVMAHMMLGEVSPGGVGVGLSGVLVMAILAVFIAGLMVGRTPEFLGKKIQSNEMKMVALYVLAMPAAVLGFTGASMLVGSVLDTTMWNTGSHGFSEILYAFASAGNNNGSAFAGITANTHWMNTTLGIAMLIGRFLLILPVLAIAGALAQKRATPATAGTFPTHTPLFVGLVVGVILIVGGLTFFPALALGPIVEHLSL
ncbi:MAG: potassium-transporting ATPase subunit KdpA [Ilumatobacteraceae bacterium]|nr:MAG: potassium-transporting ATPase subunit KdpA [Actinomycetota bacterium]